MKLRTLLFSSLTFFSTQTFSQQDPECLPKVFQPQPQSITFDNGRSGDFFRNSFLPRSDDLGDSYQYYPGTGYFVGEGNLEGILYSTDSNGLPFFNPSTTEAKRYVFQWANRCNSPSLEESNGCGSSKEAPGVSNTHGNLPEVDLTAYGHGKKERFYFTKYNKANMCTLAQAHNILGVPQQAISDFLVRWGLVEARTEQELSSELDKMVRLTDVCYLFIENGVLSSHIDGLVLDYEVQDHRADFITTNFIARYSNFVRSRSKSPILWTNPVLSAGWLRSGFSKNTTSPTSEPNGNAHLVLLPTEQNGMGMDLTSLLVYEGSGDITSELDEQSTALFHGDFNNDGLLDYNRFANRQKMYVTVGIGGFTLPQAQKVRNFVSQRSLKGIATWNNNADFRRRQTCGDEMQYQVVNCMAFGGDYCPEPESQD